MRQGVNFPPRESIPQNAWFKWWEYVQTFKGKYSVWRTRTVFLLVMTWYYIFSSPDNKYRIFTRMKYLLFCIGPQETVPGVSSWGVGWREERPPVQGSPLQQDWRGCSGASRVGAGSVLPRAAGDTVWQSGEHWVEDSEGVHGALEKGWFH